VRSIYLTGQPLARISTAAAIEERIREIGHALFAGVRRRKPLPFTQAWLDNLAMGWTMRDEALKVQLFRFVDALPGLRTNEQINRHLSEYLGPVSHRLPFGTRHLVLQQRGPLASPMRHASVRGSWRTNLLQLLPPKRLSQPSSVYAKTAWISPSTCLARRCCPIRNPTTILIPMYD
jgi:hypothetical protein